MPPPSEPPLLRTAGTLTRPDQLVREESKPRECCTRSTWIRNRAGSHSIGWRTPGGRNRSLPQLVEASLEAAASAEA
eukprot:3796877-Pyramimonas_sp.AAC.1